MRWTLLLILAGSCLAPSFSWTYHYSLDIMNWTQARRYCQTHYTDLVVIQNQEENDHLVSMLPKRTSSPYYWIGIIKTSMNESWKWVGNNSTWIGEHSWAANEPNNNHVTEFCVELYTSTGRNRGKWNDEKCSNKKYPACYRAQCNATVCDRGRCQETIGSTTCVCEPGFTGDRCQTAEEETRRTNASVACVQADGCETGLECPSLPPPANGRLRCSAGNQTCRYECLPGFLLIGSATVTCEVSGSWSGPRPACASYKLALVAAAACVAFSAVCCICFCLMKHRKRKKLAQLRQREAVTRPLSEE